MMRCIGKNCFSIFCMHLDTCMNSMNASDIEHEQTNIDNIASNTKYIVREISIKQLLIVHCNYLPYFIHHIHIITVHCDYLPYNITYCHMHKPISKYISNIPPLISMIYTNHIRPTCTHYTTYWSHSHPQLINKFHSDVYLIISNETTYTIDVYDYVLVC
jgi:hypothetical protein